MTDRVQVGIDQTESRDGKIWLRIDGQLFYLEPREMGDLCLKGMSLLKNWFLSPKFIPPNGS